MEAKEIKGHKKGSQSLLSNSSITKKDKNNKVNKHQLNENNQTSAMQN